MNKRNNFVLLVVFLIFCAAVLVVGNQFKNYKIKEYTTKKYDSIANLLTNEVETLIKEKKNATLAVAISFSKSYELKEALRNKNIKNTKKNQQILKKYSRELQKSTDFQNVWFQLIDKNGISISRSWTKKHGDNLAVIREDVRSMNNKPMIKSSISVGRFDMSFKAMVPIYESNTNYIGYLEVITHFNSIAKKIKNKEFEPVILVNEKYIKQISHPFTNIFSNNNYIANKNAEQGIVGYISEYGLKYFISPYKKYVIDNQKDMLVVNYTLFDINEEPMANFLMFKNLKDIDMSSVESFKHTIELFVVLILVITAVFFYFVSNKQDIDVETNFKTTIVIFTSIFIALSFLYYLVLQWNFEVEKEKFFHKYNKNIIHDYNIIYNKYSSIANMMYNTIINKPEILNILVGAYGDQEDKNKSRDKLYKALIKDYEYYKTNDLRQLHFHLKNNESFLRFHRPKKYGDSLTSFRETVEWVNENKKAIHGFEEGKIFNGFRHVFPLSIEKTNLDDIYLGSVEVSFSAFALAREFARVHNSKVSFIISDSVVKDKVFQSEQYNYSVSPFDGYMYEKHLKNQFEHALMHINVDLLDNNYLNVVLQRISNGEIFSIQSKDKNILFTFMPIKNPITNKVVASFILQQESMELSEKDNLKIIFLLSGIAAILFIMLYVYKEFSSKHQFRLLSLKNKKILDAQNSIVVITNGKEIIDANKKLLLYFGYKSLKDFRSEHQCICEYFEESSRFFHLGKVPENEVWVETIEKLPFKEHIVAMKDSNGKQNIFFVSINSFDNNHILSFSNISDTMTEHFSLLERVVHDKLTGAYNRDFFDTRKDFWIQEIKYKKLELGIIILDIDYFKNVNDTYGHNCGDLILQDLVSLISKAIRQEDMLIRWGGEEFIIVSYVSSLDNLYNIAENIRKKVEVETFKEVGNITCSFGVTVYKDEMIEETIERADQALYKAKKSGRNRVVWKSKV